jgi:hypothetical protein
MLGNYKRLHDPRDWRGEPVSVYDELKAHWRDSEEYEEVRWKTATAAGERCFICGIVTTAPFRDRPTDGTLQHLDYPNEPFAEKILWRDARSLRYGVHAMWLCWGCHQKVDAPDRDKKGQRPTAYDSRREMVMARILRTEQLKRRPHGDQLSLTLDEDDGSDEDDEQPE